ncbi:MFS transporter [Evansella tamaricis]|uniref:MFS transporter n=1 Tax=Evansella tamaricis TaxID=2069301 RepID=A0ABS6JIT3_9BACI|nr:MFS transporter [Evansella tamaricis]MBU9713562.1 MFS transporter [Evansella tamaricis]
MTEITAKQPSIWKNGIFMRLFASYTVSMMGNYFDTIALMILFGYIWKVDPVLIALIPVAMALPQALLSQFSGVLTDRVNKVKIMMYSDLLTAVLTLFLLLIASPWIALLIITLRSIVNVVHFPAQQGLIKEVVSEVQILKAISLNGIVMQISKIIAPFVGGILASAFSPQLCILINAIAFFLSTLILLSIIVQKNIKYKAVAEDLSHEANVEKKEGFWKSWKDGWKSVFQSRILLAGFGFFFMALLVMSMVDIQAIILLREIAPNRPEMIGWLAAASGFGAVLMIMILNRFEILYGYGWLMGGSLICLGVGYGGMGLLQVGFSSWIVIIYGIILGVGVGLYTVGFQYIMQRHTVKNNIGRVSGISNSIASFCVVIGPLFGGILVESIGPSIIFITIGITNVLLGAIGIMFQRILWKHQPSSVLEFPETSKKSNV